MFAICDAFEAYGYRTWGAALRQQGFVVNHKKIRRLMRETCPTAPDSQALRRHDRQRSRRSDLAESGEESRCNRS
jgi:exoribonuclease II